MHDRLWFELGWDYASYDLRLPDESPQPMLTGYKEGKDRFKKPVAEVDRYVRKWLQLRFNALRRNRQFDTEVTVDFLRSIDTDICPVTWEPLTHGTKSGTDWSVDRIVNDGAYSQGNLMVISTRVNQAKGAMGLEEIAAGAITENKGNQILTPLEWRRLLYLVYAVHYRSNASPYTLEWIPISPHYPPHLAWPLAFDVQYNLVMWATDLACNGRFLRGEDKAHHRREYQRIKSFCTSGGTKVLAKLMSRMIEYAPTVSHPELLMWIDPIFHLYKKLIEGGFVDGGTIPKRWPDIVRGDKAAVAREFSRQTGGYIA